MARTPDYVREFLRHVPSIWDDVRFIDGFPGKYVVIARHGNGRWFVAGINAEHSEKTLELPLTQLGVAGGGTLITDGDGPNLSFRNEPVQLGAGQKLSVKLRARGGFVIAFD
jgi:hypothetical protein